MNTLGKQITKQFFQAEDGFNQLETYWKQKWQDKSHRDLLEPVHFFLYQAIRGKDWKKGFTPITNQVKIDAGMQVDGAINRVLHRLRNDPKSALEKFNGHITLEAVNILLTLLPKDLTELRHGDAYVMVDQAA